MPRCPRLLEHLLFFDVLTIYLIRHAHPVMPGTPGYSEHDRPLSETGARDVHALALEFQRVTLDAVYSSPYLRAVQTVRPLADQFGLEVGLLDDLRERTLSPEPRSDWLEQIKRTWENVDYRLSGGESNRDARIRGLQALETVRNKHLAGTVALGSHGNLIAITLNALDARVNFDVWQAMPMPAVYRLEFHDGWRVVSGPGI